ncbi:hypothetical protein DUNSADRAFT_5670 [Dunaliella salina]|uniref:Uncharacterized protein n=1 Tax=Dunaliella salina TaxID=3046 RepID=A0ABQ7FU76_DUNSA|nr:hypothetical protein DUNSADRAFT_5670 [Dunaliella salina]|eukprot:KAF5825959.1 hypothetical protein DUNSADRAFT_5670 [Dunaliella salina]
MRGVHTRVEHTSPHCSRPPGSYMQAFDILKAALGPQHQDTLHTLAVATLLLINSSTTRIQVNFMDVSL